MRCRAGHSAKIQRGLMIRIGLAGRNVAPSCRVVLVNANSPGVARMPRVIFQLYHCARHEGRRCSVMLWKGFAWAAPIYGASPGTGGIVVGNYTKGSSGPSGTFTTVGSPRQGYGMTQRHNAAECGASRRVRQFVGMSRALRRCARRCACASPRQNRPSRFYEARITTLSRAPNAGELPGAFQ